MATHAIITVSDHNEQFHIYRHHDGQPENVLPEIDVALTKAWPLPRFEASEFTAACIAVMKQSSGGIYLVSNPNIPFVSYRYRVTARGNALQISY